MSTTLHVVWVKTVVDAGGGVTKYRLATTCSAPGGTVPLPDAKVILFQDATPTDLYVHVCTAGDMLTFPGTPPGPPGYYRAVTVTQDFDTPDEAVAEETLQRARIQNLVTDWNAGYGTYPGTDTEDISS